ncbi:helix-turn-helix domain-containing protein [Heyndrickxia sporothermodurans]
MSIHNRLRIIRDELNLTQKELGAIMGRKQSEISKWETGKQAIPAEILEDFIKVTHLSNEQLIFLIQGEQDGKEFHPKDINDHFTTAKVLDVHNLFQDEPDLSNELHILSKYPEKQKRRLINNLIAIMKNERE